MVKKSRSNTKHQTRFTKPVFPVIYTFRKAFFASLVSGKKAPKLSIPHAHILAALSLNLSVVYTSHPPKNRSPLKRTHTHIHYAISTSHCVQLIYSCLYRLVVFFSHKSLFRRKSFACLSIGVVPWGGGYINSTATKAQHIGWLNVCFV